MLVLTRKTEEKIVIGKEKKIVITILKIQGDKVSVGIEADKDTPIFRNELLLKEVERANQNGVVNKQTLPAKEIAEALRNEIESRTTKVTAEEPKEESLI